MTKCVKSVLDDHAEWLTDFFDSGGKLREAQAELAKRGCVVKSLSRLSVWWAGVRSQRDTERMLQRISTGAAQVKSIEDAFGANPAPALATIMGMHRLLAAQMATQAECDPEALESLQGLMKNVLDYAKLEQKRAEFELSQRKYQDQVEKATAIVQDKELSESQRISRMREVFGIPG